jgi:hypothetical protein
MMATQNRRKNMGLKIVTGRTGTPHVSSNQIQAFNRSLLGDLAILDLGQHFDAVVRDANTIRIYDGCIVIQGIYAIIPHDEYEDILVEPVSVGNTRIDTIYLHYAKDMENDTESVEIDIAQGEEAVNNPVKPDIDAGGDTWEGTTDIRIPLYDVTVTSFETTITAYEYMDVYSPTISDLQERIPETTVSGVKGDAESEYRSGNVNITSANIGLGNVDNTADLDKPVSTAQQSALDDKIDKVTGKGLSTNDYTDAEKQKNADNASAIEDLQEDLSTSLTATGNPITIEASESNLVECVAKVEAIQDLHGYDKPWVGGAGKNKLPMTVEGIKSANTSGTWSGNVYTLSGVIFTLLTDSDGNLIGIKLGGTSSADNVKLRIATNVVLSAETILNGITGGTASTYRIDVTKTGSTDFLADGSKTLSANTYTFDINIRFASVQLNTTLYPMVRLATETDSTFAPYENKSPITGQTEVVIKDVGKNLCPYTESGTINNSGKDMANDAYARTPYIAVNEGVEYTFSVNPLQGKSIRISINFFSQKDTHIISELLQTTNSINFVPPAGSNYIKIVLFTTDNASPAISYFENPQLELGTTATEYEPYKGKTYTIQLGDTIYGGELDVLTGKMRVTHGYIESYNGEPLPSTWISDRDEYSEGTTPTIGAQVVYELAEPYTIQLTPQQIRLLKGTNHLSCNTGDLTIKYYPDNVLGQLKGDIEKGLNAYYDYQIKALWDKIGELQA